MPNTVEMAVEIAARSCVTGPRRDNAIMAEPQFDPSVGDVLGKYLLAHLIDEDENSLLFQALHRRLSHPLALRVPRLRLLASRPELRRELLEQARLLASVNHAHLIRLLDFDDDGPTPYLVFEFVKGLSLRQLIKQSGRLRWDRGVRLLTQIASALAAACQAGTFHGRLWPGQVLVTPDGAGKLILGCQALRRDLGADDPHIAYRAPEQRAPGMPVDHQADIFALGVIGYEMLSGRLPGQAKPRPLHEALMEVPPPVSELIQRMLAANAGERIDSYATLLHELQAIRLPGWAVQD